MMKHVLVVAIVGSAVLPSWGGVIISSDDVTFRGSTRQNNNTPFGLFARGGADRAYAEFTLGATPATSATLSLYNAWNKASSPVNRDVQITGGLGDFDELTVTEPMINAIEGGFAPTLPDNTFHVNDVPQWYTLDITAFYNANLGQTVSIAIRVIGGGGDGPIFVDHEGTPQSGSTIEFAGGPGYEPHITWVPEPASLVLLAAGSCLVVRRRRA